MKYDYLASLNEIQCICHIHEQQEMSQTRDECPQRNWSSTRHI